MKRIMLYQHGGSYNHGCEALATTVPMIIKDAVDETQVFLCSGQPKQDKRYDIENLDKIVDSGNPTKRWTPVFFIYQLNKRLIKSKKFREKIMKFRGCIKRSKNMDALVAIGGDMYCYSKGKDYWNTDKTLKAKGKKLMLWACSIEPADIPGELAEHLKVFDLITARESITYEALVANGLADKAYLVTDPAFLLKKEELPLPRNWKAGNMVGINLSPLVLKYTENKNQVVQSVYSLIEYILKNTDMNVALIPHVRIKGTDDVTVMEPIYNHFKETDRIVLLDDMALGCKELKGYISRCRFFVGARTHSVIAAYSTCVPALAIGYSVKANGIAKDIFGYTDNLVLPVQTLSSSEAVIDSFNYLVENEAKLKSHLEQTMPEYKENAKITGHLLNKLINEG